jgi:hypothetical protein
MVMTDAEVDAFFEHPPPEVVDAVLRSPAVRAVIADRGQLSRREEIGVVLVAARRDPVLVMAIGAASLIAGGHYLQDYLGFTAAEVEEMLEGWAERQRHNMRA